MIFFCTPRFEFLVKGSLWVGCFNCSNIKKDSGQEVWMAEGLGPPPITQKPMVGKLMGDQICYKQDFTPEWPPK